MLFWKRSDDPVLNSSFCLQLKRISQRCVDWATDEGGPVAGHHFLTVAFSGFPRNFVSGRWVSGRGPLGGTFSSGASFVDVMISLR